MDAMNAFRKKGLNVKKNNLQINFKLLRSRLQRFPGSFKIQINKTWIAQGLEVT